MKRFVFVVPPLVGHVNPTVSVGQALLARGHEVVWVGHPRRVAPLLPKGARLFALDDGISDEVWRPVLERSRTVRGLESLQFLWEEVLVPLARGMLPGVRQALATLAPDVVVADQQAIAGALAARERGLPWATFCTTSATVVDPLADLPRVKAWVASALASLEREAGLPPSETPDLSPHLVVVFSTRALLGETCVVPPHYRFVGPAAAERPEEPGFPWDRLGEGPRVFVSLGTVSADGADAFYNTLVDALRDEPVQVIVAAPPERIPNPPPNFLVAARVPQVALLKRVDAVVCHAGHNTVCEALAEGLPLVVAPIRDDQPVIAGQVVNAGCGVRLKYGRLRPDALRDAVRRALHEPALRASAARLRASFAAAGGAAAAASHLEAFSC